MTSIELTVAEARVWASVTGNLTSGMVGIPVTIHYDEVWDGLRKNLVCRCSRQGTANGEHRAILNVGETATVAHEVMKPNMYLYLGVEGYSPDGKLVIPTAWAECGEIQSGANTGTDLSADSTLPIWNQLQTQIEQIKCDTFPQEQMDEIKVCAQAAIQAAADAARSEENAGISAANAAEKANDALRFQRAAEAAAVRAENAAGSIQNSNQSGGLTSELKTALKVYFTNVQTLIGQTAYSVQNPVADTVIGNAQAVIYALEDQPEQPASGIIQSGSILAITSGVTVTQLGSELTIS